MMEIKGVEVCIEYLDDSDSDPPWDNSDGHGPVRISRTVNYTGRHTKRPGERPMNSPCRNQYQYLYDWQEACRLARKDGWNTEPYDAPNQVARAVQADFDFLRGWINDDWRYVGVRVTIPGTSFEDSLWGVETYKDYHETCAKEQAEELVTAYLAEQKEVEYWNSRDVVTEVS